MSDFTMATDLELLQILDDLADAPFSDSEIAACFGPTDPDFYFE